MVGKRLAPRMMYLLADSCTDELSSSRDVRKYGLVRKRSQECDMEGCVLVP